MIEIANQDSDSRAYSDIAKVFRPGHGDITYHAKYGLRDWRGGGRASARETAARVAAGAVAQAFLDGYGIKINSCTMELGGVKASTIDWSETENNRFQSPDKSVVKAMEDRINGVKKLGDSVGGVVEIRAINVPAGLGEPVFDKLDAQLASALMGIGAVKAVEIGAGCAAARMTGSENNDSILENGFETNRSGGVLGGISNGDEIIVRVYVKPIPSIVKEQKTIDENGRQTMLSIKGRHDVSAIPRINPVCRAMVAIVLADLLLRQRAVRG